MNLSIFSSKFFRQFMLALRSQGQHVLGRMILLFVTYVVSVFLLHKVFFFKNFQVQAVEALSPQIKVLGIGSSRMFFGVDPRLISKNYMSLAANYLDMEGAQRIWQHHASKVPNVRTVLLEFGMSTLYYDMHELSPNALQPLGLDIWPTAEDFLTRFDYAVRLVMSPVFRWRLTPRFIALNDSMTHDPDESQAATPGHVPSRIKVPVPKEYAKRKAEQTREHLQTFASDVFARNMDSLLRMVKDLDSRGIRVVFIRFPKVQDAWSFYDPSWDERVKEAFLAVTGATKTHEFLDLSRDRRFSADEFRDPDHLNQKGAEKLSGILASYFAPDL